MNKNKTLNTRSLVTMAMFAAILCVSAYISIPLPNGSHITALNFVVTLIILTFSVSQSVSIIAVWLLLGIVGVPVFIGGNAGIGYLLGSYGGYSFSFVLIAILIPLLAGKTYNRVYYTILGVLSAVIVDLVGTFWLMVVGGLSLKAAFIAGFAPFILLDIVKVVIAAQIVPQFRRILVSE